MEYAQVLSLHAGEAYAMQNLTRTDRLGLLLSGKVIVLMIPEAVQLSGCDSIKVVKGGRGRR